jgi:hypothetical protein
VAKARKYILRTLFVVVAAVLAIYLWVVAYPEIASHSVAGLRVETNDFQVQSGRFLLTLEGVDSISFSAGEAEAHGHDISFYKVSGHRTVTRPLPGETAGFTERDTSWQLVGEKRTDKTEAQHSIRTFRNKVTGKQLQVWLPFFADEPKWIARSDARHRVLIILSDSAWKHGVGVYLGFIVLE